MVHFLLAYVSLPECRILFGNRIQTFTRDRSSFFQSLPAGVRHILIAIYPSSRSWKIHGSSRTGWWLNQPIWKILVKLEIFPIIGVKIKKLKPPPRKLWRRKTIEVLHGCFMATWAQSRNMNTDSGQENLDRDRKDTVTHPQLIIQAVYSCWLIIE